MMKGPKTRVLIACREATLLLGLRALLEQRRYTVLTASTDAQVNDYVMGGHADILLLGDGLRASRFTIPIVPIGRNAREMLVELEATARLLSPRVAASRTSMRSAEPGAGVREAEGRIQTIAALADTASAKGVITSIQRRGGWYRIQAPSGEHNLLASGAEHLLRTLLSTDQTAGPVPAGA